ncbi:MAG: hypothetical protein HFF38_00980 [Lawsonibacter sp.]|nr:hypothetical protein [Lawsonibacter sp.]
MYEEMYYILERGINEAMDKIEAEEYQEALICLEQASRAAEEKYIGG